MSTPPEVAVRACALAAWLAATASSAQALTPQEVYAHVSPSVWKVLTYDQDGLPLGQGSAVVIAAETLVTNCHVLAKSRRVVVRREGVSLEAKLDLWDPQRDVCQLRAPKLAAPAVAVGDAAGLVVGQPAYAIGNPKGLDLTMSAGLVSSLRRNAAGQLFLIQTSAAISGGSSGGGLFDEQGTLVGLTTIGSITGDAQNLNFAVPAEWIRELPQRHANLVAIKAAASAVAGTLAPAPATAAAQPPVVTAPPSARVPTGADGETDVARLDDVDRLPFATDKMREGYRAFLTRKAPRAFAISEPGVWAYASGTVAPNPEASSDPVERALQACRKSSTSRCFVYAADYRVVYRAGVDESSR
jgi:serine protease Do